MNPIFQALSRGYNAQHILKYISQINPALSKQISAALNAGHTIEHVLNFMARNSKNIQKIVPQENVQSTGNLYKIAQSSIHPSLKGAAKFAATGALVAGGAAALSRLLPTAQTLINSNIPKGLPPIGPNPIPNSPTPPPGPIANPNQPIQPPQNLIHQAKQPSTNVPVPLPNQPIEPALPQQPIGVAPSDVIRNAQLNQLIDSMANDKVSPEDISDYIANSYPEHAKHIQEQTREPLVNSIYRYLGKKQKKPGLVQGLENQFNQQYGNQDGTQLAGNQPSNQIQPSPEGPIAQEGANIIQNQNVVERENRSPVEKAKKENGDVVQLPDGEIGTIESIKKDHVVVDIDGKKRPVKLDQLEDIPIQKKDLADLHEELIRGIEEEIGSDVSRNVNWAGYDPQTNRLSYLPHDGALYVYDDIDPEDAKLLTNILSTRKSSGGNFIGPWIAGTKSPIGAAMSALIKRLQEQRGGKGKEYSGKFETLYSHLEPAVKAAKAKKKKRK